MTVNYLISGGWLQVCCPAPSGILVGIFICIPTLKPPRPLSHRHLLLACLTFVCKPKLGQLRNQAWPLSGFLPTPVVSATYFHRNNIEVLHGLSGLSALITLSLAHNRLRNIEGLEALRSLRNLHIQGNRLKWVHFYDTCLPASKACNFCLPCRRASECSASCTDGTDGTACPAGPTRISCSPGASNLCTCSRAAGL